MGLNVVGQFSIVSLEPKPRQSEPLHPFVALKPFRILQK